MHGFVHNRNVFVHNRHFFVPKKKSRSVVHDLEIVAGPPGPGSIKRGSRVEVSPQLPRRAHRASERISSNLQQPVQGLPRLVIILLEMTTDRRPGIGFRAFVRLALGNGCARPIHPKIH